MPPKTLDLSKGTVIHIEDFKSFGYEAKDKYLVVFGSESRTQVLAFTITTTDWTSHPRNAREVVEIPAGTVPGLPRKCWIRCFHHPEQLDVQQLEHGFKNYKVSVKGKLPVEYLQKIKDVIECSDVLTRMDIADCIEAMAKDLHEKK